jgi:signal transduction histidine kinase
VRVAVLPRDDAARIITSALARGFAAINAVSLSLAIPMLIEFMADRGLARSLPIPLAILVVLVALAVLCAVRPVRSSLVLFLTLGGAGAVIFPVLLIQAYPAMLTEGLYIANRPAVALVLAGVTASTVVSGFLWTVFGLALSTGTSVLVSVIAGVPFQPGYGAFLTFLASSVSYGALGAIQARLRRRVPDFDALEAQTRRDVLEENLTMRVTAAVHDTLLNDLSLVMNAPDRLDERARRRLRDDVATLTSAEWLAESSAVVLDAQDSDLRNRVLRIIHDLQWRGLTVHITVSGTGIVRLAAGVPEAMLDAVRASLENVLRHAGTHVAELDLAYTDDAITIVVSDNGVGFDPAAVAHDRLGVRASIVGRIEAIGGSVRIWSTPGAGTSVIITVPGERVTEHEEPTHARP